MSPTPQDVAAALAELGDTADAVAASLERLGVVGDKAEPDSCPLARYLSRRFPEAGGDVGVNLISARVGTAGVCKPGIVVGETVGYEPLLTTIVINFVERFDDGLYPELVDMREPLE